MNRPINQVFLGGDPYSSFDDIDMFSWLFIVVVDVVIDTLFWYKNIVYSVFVVAVDPDAFIDRIGIFVLFIDEYFIPSANNKS